MRRVFLLCLFPLMVAACKPDQSVWPEVKKEMRPWARWWWMGSAVDKPNLNAEMSNYAAKGFGGLEITPIYGAKGFEDKYIPFLSPQWMEMLDYTLQKADSLDMGIDMNTGTGWPFGGPHITMDHAASRLIVQPYTLSAGQKIDKPLAVENTKQSLGAKLEAVVAYGENGQVEDLTRLVDTTGMLNWSPAGGKWTVYAAFCGKTLQKVKRSAPGGEGYTFDHLSTEALKTYLSRFDEAFAGKRYPVRCFFNDSYEVFGASWSPVFFDEFKARRGYDLRLHLRELNGDGDSLDVARIKCDYRQTMSDLVHDHFTVGWTNWAHSRQSLTRNQSHGSPANLLDLYTTVDIPEIETFGAGEFPIPGFRRDSADVKYSDTDPLFQKFASSGAHTSGRNLVSCETFTWLREHFKEAWSHAKPELDQLFVSGVNHVFFHGTTYSPQEAAWPGWLFYASTHFGTTNSAWDHLDGMTSYITRCQSVLQSGSHDNEVLVYWPVFDIWQNAKGMETQFTVHNAHKWLHMQPIRQLMAQGYLFDFVSDAQILATQFNGQGLVTNPNVKPYRTLIVPECALMPLETLEKLIALAGSGARVVFEKLPDDVPGYGSLSERRQRFRSLLAPLSFHETTNGSVAKTGTGEIIVSKDLASALKSVGVSRETLTDTGLSFARRRIDNGYYYFVTNLTATAIDAYVPLERHASQVVIMDPMNGRFGLAAVESGAGGMKVRLQLKSGESTILKLTDKTSEISAWDYLPPVLATTEISGPWKLEFIKGGPVLPKPLELPQATYWTMLGDADMDNFSGTAAYSAKFNIDTPLAKRYRLRFDNLRESARVFVNGHEAGVVWALPFIAEVGDYVRVGENHIRIEVANLMANRIRYMDRNGIEWRKFHEINFVNIAYKPFDATNWEIQPSGLAGPVMLESLGF
ncbi:MAG: glycosyl hydrolase [Breznakibacter sp.]